MRFNLNTILALLAALGVFAPDLQAVASFLAGLHISWMSYVVRAVSLLAAFCAAAPLIVPRLRGFFALLGLATPPGAVVPGGQANAAPVIGQARQPEPGSVTVPVSSSEAETPVLPRGTKGIAGERVMGILLLASVLAILLIAGTAHAQQFGGCFAEGKVCAGPSATVTVGEFNLASSKFSGGVSPGLGYGLTYQPDQWYATGLAAYLAFSVGGSTPNSARPSLMISFANYVRVGVGMAISEQDVGVLKQWSVLFGLGSDFGGSPKYLRAAGALR